MENNISAALMRVKKDCSYSVSISYIVTAKNFTQLLSSKIEINKPF